MVRVTSGALEGSVEAPLALVPRRRRAASLVVVIVAFVFALMFAAAAFQTQLARRQLTLDSLDRDIRGAHEQYDQLRRARAELRSPGRLIAEGGALGMAPASGTEFMELSPDVIATVQRSAGGVFSIPDGPGETVFDEFGIVKSVAGGAP